LFAPYVWTGHFMYFRAVLQSNDAQLMKTNKYIFRAGQSQLQQFKTLHKNGFKSKEDAEHQLQKKIAKLSETQDVFFAHKKYGLLIILQGMDGSGKDSMIKHVFSGINPQGMRVHSFSTPSAEEFSHDYMWRIVKALPERGHIGVFNRSHYEEVLIARVHPEFLNKQQLPDLPETAVEYERFWQMRFEDISNFERYLTNNGIMVLKFFLHISKEEQKKRFLRRIDRVHKNWKFRADDLSERAYWDRYQEVYEEMMHATSTDFAPWYVIPADEKKYARPLVCDIIQQKFKEMDLHYPRVSFKDRRAIIESRERLLNEDEKPLEQGLIRLYNKPPRAFSPSRIRNTWPIILEFR
jgi:PPK2 family polyphosphate:nucleotide phosphotransferase